MNEPGSGFGPAIQRLDSALADARTTEEVLERTVGVVTTASPHADDASALRWDAGSARFSHSVSTIVGESDGLAARRVRLDGASNWIINNGESFAVADVVDDPFGANPMLEEAGIRAYAGVPLEAGGAVHGILYALHRAPGEPSWSEFSLLRAIGRRAAEAIERTAASPVPPAAAPPAAARSVTVLIVDDDPGLRGSLAGALDLMSGVSVATAASSADALVRIGATPPDLIILDVNLGAENGLDVCPSLLTAAPGSTMLWFMTGDPNNIDEARARRIGAEGFLLKPFGRREIITLIETVRARF